MTELAPATVELIRVIAYAIGIGTTVLLFAKWLATVIRIST